MTKVVALFRKKDGLSSKQLRDTYENHHARLFAGVLEMPGVEGYVRHYLTPMRDAISGETPSSCFDVIMGIWFSNRTTFETYYGAPLDPAFVDRIADDEGRLFDRSHMFLHTVEEIDSDISAVPHGAPARRPGDGA